MLRVASRTDVLLSHVSPVAKDVWQSSHRVLSTAVVRRSAIARRMSDGVAAVRFGASPLANQLRRDPKAFRQSLHRRTGTRIGRRLELEARAVPVLIYLSSLRHRATYAGTKLAASRPLDEPRAVPYRVTYRRCVHPPFELIEDLLGNLLAQAVELPRERTLLRF